jgi:Aldo/keto reductase family
VETWRALESLVDGGQCKSIGLSDIGLEKLREVVAAARIKPAVVQVESHPYLPEWELLEFWQRALNCHPGVRSVGTFLGAKTIGRPGHHGYSAAREQNAGLSGAGLGCTARNRLPDHLDNTPPHPRRTSRFRPCLKTRCGRFGTGSRRGFGSTRWWRPACLDLFPGRTELNLAARDRNSFGEHCAARERAGRHRSTTTSPTGREQQISTLPVAGRSSG